MTKEKIDMMVEGGKAVAGPAVGQKLGPLKINIGDVLAKINEKTKDFKGMKVPVKLIVDTDTKEFEIEVGTPPVSELLKTELGIEKGSGIPDKHKAGNAAIEQVIKVAKMKKDAMYAGSLKAAVKNVIGSCNSAGILVEGKPAKEVISDVNEGRYDKEINEGKTEADPEKLKKLKADLEASQEQTKHLLVKEKPEEVAAAEGEAPKEGEKKEEPKAEKKEAKKSAKKK